MDLRAVAMRLAAKTYGDALKSAGDRLKMLEDAIERCRKDILGLHSRKDQMCSKEWHEMLAALVAQMKQLKRMHWDTELLLRRLVTEPKNETLWENL